ncbi:MAG: CxxxxCH/CxxCH domain-containing protein [Deltaproteobacteria bacterium]|nr:CxxxxCH/CxxCH domain-containing protein [Deltaproteobacteria bacterium]
MKRLALLCLFLFMSACSSPNSGSVFSPEGADHPSNWVQVHGKHYEKDPDQCTKCHGDALTGGLAKVSCSTASRNGITCHPNDPPHLETLINSDGTVRSDNARLLCGKCHDLKDFFNQQRFKCQRCHSDPSDHSDPLNGVMKEAYPEPFPYGFGTAPVVESHSSENVGTEYGNWHIDCVTCHNPHSQEQDRAKGTHFGKLLREDITYTNNVTGETVGGEVQVNDLTDTPLTGESVPSGKSICEVCHTRTIHHRNDGSGPGDLDIDGKPIEHGADRPCTDCHTHDGGFKPEVKTGHPEGWVNVADKGGSHGPSYLADAQDCTKCHGADLLGGIAKVGCNTPDRNGISCHPYDPPHIAPLKNPDDTIRSDNAALLCGKCHDRNNFFNDQRYKCQRCHSDPDDTDPLNGVMKAAYPDAFPYGFGSAPVVKTHSSKVVGTKYGNWDMGTKNCVTCHDPHTQEQNRAFGTSYGKLLRRNISYDNTVTGQTLTGTVTLTASSGTDSFADGAPHDENICEICHTRTNHHRNDGQAPGDLDSNGNYVGHNDGANCMACHPHDKGMKPQCGTCHEVPPKTGTHLIHFGGSVDQAVYGSTKIAQDVISQSSVYLMNCGNCHPMDILKHMDGVANSGGGSAEIELYSPNAPAGSLKAKNPKTATYTPGTQVFVDDGGRIPLTYTKGTCSNVYCHSETVTTTTDAVPEPTVVDGNIIYPLIYDPTWQSLVVQTRRYRTPQWGVDQFGCNGCHGFPIINDASVDSAGAGDSHGWRDQNGDVSLHAWNMGFGPLQCRTCHYDTVRDEAPWTQDAQGETTFENVDIFNKAKHVNGTKDVVFTPDPVTLKTPQDLSTASFDPATKTCTNVACHQNQTSVTWGSPYRYTVSAECNVCHQAR